MATHRGRLSAAVVTYQPDLNALDALIRSLDAAWCAAAPAGPPLPLCVVDNSPRADAGGQLEAWLGGRSTSLDAGVLAGHGNIGYGAAHNLALMRLDAEYHLALNPDVVLDADSIRYAIEFFRLHPGVGLLAPAVYGSDGRLQYLVRRQPAVADLFLRGFAPAWLRRRFTERISRYEMRDRVDAHTVVWDPELVSGCCMFFRRSVLDSVGGFDPRFFLYFEDYDLSLRLAGRGRIVYVPQVKVVHYGGNAARKGREHVVWFVRSALRFYRRHGWRWW